MNCTTPTRQPRPSARSARPKAAVDLPLPGPVWTMSRPFSRIGLGGDFRVLRGLALDHFCFVAVVFDAAHGMLSGEGGALLGGLRPDLKSGRA